MKLSGYSDDTEKKTDMNFVLRRTKEQPYQTIPTQFTVCARRGLNKKKESIENFLNSQLEKEGTLRDGFLLLAVNGDFKMVFNKPGEENQIISEYKKRVENPEEREKNTSKGFPLFINTIDPKITKSAEVMYAALHMLFKKYTFKKGEKSDYLTACRKT